MYSTEFKRAPIAPESIPDLLHILRAVETYYEDVRGKLTLNEQAVLIALQLEVLHENGITPPSLLNRTKMIADEKEGLSDEAVLKILVAATYLDECFPHPQECEDRHRREKEAIRAMASAKSGKMPLRLKGDLIVDRLEIIEDRLTLLNASPLKNKVGAVPTEELSEQEISILEVLGLKNLTKTFAVRCAKPSAVFYEHMVRNNLSSISQADGPF